MKSIIELDAYIANYQHLVTNHMATFKHIDCNTDFLVRANGCDFISM